MGETLQFDPGIAAGLAVGAAISLFFPFALAIWLWIKTRVSWKYWSYGSLIFVLFQLVLRLPWLIPLQSAVNPSIAASSQPVVYTVLWFVFLAFTASLFETFGRWVGYRWLVKDERTWRVGVMYGLGHGGIESVLLAGLSIASSLATYILYTTNQLQLPEDQARLVTGAFANLNFFTAMLGGIERIFAITFHVSQSLLVLAGLLQKEIRWFLLAFALHFIVDFAAVTLTTYVNVYVAEAVVGLVAALSLWIILRLRQMPGQYRAGEPLPAEAQAK